MRPFFAISVGLWLVFSSNCTAKIINPLTLEQVVKDQPLIFTAKISEWFPDKPAMVLIPDEILRGKFPFNRIPVILTGDREAEDEKQIPKLLERLDKDVTLIFFASQRGKAIDAIGFTNGTWLHFMGVIENQDDRSVTRWRFTHAETYFTRTFKGTTEELLKAVKGGIKGEKLPPFDEKAEPGFGPPLKKKTSSLNPGFTPLGVIQLPFLGLIAALAAIFPAVFGGLALMMKRWVAALSVASFITILTSLYLYFPNWIRWAGLTTFSRVWFTCAVISSVGALWAIRRYRVAKIQQRAEDYQPRYLDRAGLAGLLFFIVTALVTASILKWPLIESPFLELILLSVPATACLFSLLLVWFRQDSETVAVSTETIGLWAGSFACALAGMYFTIPPVKAPTQVAGNTGIKLEAEPVWVFQPTEGGEVLSTPIIVNDRVIVAVHHRQGFSQFGRIYALEKETGKILWEFDDEGSLKPIFSSPAHSGDTVFIGEGYHTDRDSKLYAIDVATGKKRWEFATTSHTESTPATDGERVVFGAGDDGVYCVNAKTGEKQWQYTGENGLHVDSNVLLFNGKIYGGSGTSQRRKENRIFCLDLKTGKEIWGEKIEYSSWGSAISDGKNIYFPTGNGTMSYDRDPKAGLLLCRDSLKGTPVWQKALPNSLVGQPSIDRFQVYVGCRDGLLYAIDRTTGDEVWNSPLGSPVLASPVVVSDPKTHVSEVVYCVSQSGNLQALSPLNGKSFWGLDVRSLTQQPYASTVSTPVVFRESGKEQSTRRILVGMGFGLSASASPTARLYCFRDTSE